MNTLRAETQLILRNDLRLLWRDVRAGKLKVFSSLAMAGLVLGVLHAIVILLCLTLHVSPPLVVENMIWAFFLFMMLGAAMNHAISLLFERADFDLLLASPVSARAVLLARLASMTVGAFFSATLLLLPLLNGSIIGISPRYFAGYLVWLLLAALVASGGIWLSLALVSWLGPRKARMWIQVIAGTLGAGIYIAFQSQNFLPVEDKRIVWRTLANTLNTPLASIVARAGRGAPLALLELFGLTAVVMAITTRQLARVFITGVQEAGARPAKKGTIGRYRLRDGLRLATFRKDARLIARDPLLLSQVLPSAMYFLPLVLGFGRGNFSAAVPALALALAANFSAILTAVAVSGDEGWDLIRISPASSIQIRLGKMAAGLAIPTGVAALLCIVVAGLGRPWLAVVAFLSSIICSLGCAWLEVVTIRPTPRQDIVRRQGAQRSWGRSLTQFAMLGSGATGLAMIDRDMAWFGSALLGLMVLGVIACFTLAEVQEFPSD